MGVIGKIVGGTIGFAMGGPLGAIAGTALGHAFDLSNQAVEQQAQQARPLPSRNEEAQLTFFVGAFSMLAKLAKADGNISAPEIQVINNFMTNELNLNFQSRQYATDVFNQALESHHTFSQFAAQFYARFYDQPQLLELMIDILFRVAVADGNPTEAEENLIHTAARQFNFSDALYAKIKSRYITVKQTSASYAVLDCQPTDSDETIKKQYRQKVREYHPDTIAAKGLPDEFTKFAEKKFVEIREAYEQIKQERGIR